MVEGMRLGAVESTQDERTMAILAHVLQIVGWWIPPLVIFLVKRESKFTAFHALQALFLQALYLLVAGIGMIFWFATIFLIMAHAPATRNAPPPPAFFIVMPLLWLGWMGMWVTMMVIVVVYGIKAGRGE